MDKTRFMKFVGGNNLIFSLVVLILLGIVIFLYDSISFIFNPLVTILSSIIVPVVLAIITFYLFNPIIDWLEKHKIKRIYGIILLFVTIIGLLTTLIILVYPIIQEQVMSLIQAFPEYLDSITLTIEEWSENSVFEEAIYNATEWFNSLLGNLPSNISDYLGTAASGISNVFSTVSSIAVVAATFPIILFFLLKDSERFTKYMMELIPPKFRKDTTAVLSTMNEQVSSYIKGQLIICVCIGVMMFIGFTIIGLDYAIILAIVVSVTAIIPYIGPTIAIIPAIIVALIDSPFMLIKLIIVWVVVQFIDGNLIEPNIQGKSLDVHPLTIIIVLLVMGDLLGLVGLILGVPIYAILKVLVNFIFQKLKMRYNKYYGSDAGEYKVEFFGKKEEIED